MRAPSVVNGHGKQPLLGGVPPMITGNGKKKQHKINRREENLLKRKREKEKGVVDPGEELVAAEREKTRPGT